MQQKLVADNEMRSEIIDFLRGIAILDMILVHFSKYMPPLLEKILNYTDIAVESFVLLTGFMVGYHYFPKYNSDRRRITKRLVSRALQILVIQYVMILTINVPLYYLLFDRIRETEPLSSFLFRSSLFLNQIGLIHILPTFIPLLLVSPIILYALTKGHSCLVAVCSLMLFGLGNVYPHAIDFGDRTIFPFILWQVYFVAGCLLGKEAYVRKKLGPDEIQNWLYAAVIILCIGMFIKHGKVVPPGLTSKFPLNVLGVIYGVSLLFFVYAIVLRYWGILKKFRLCTRYVPLLGRHSLLVFCIHVYTAYLLAIVNRYYVSPIFNYFFVLVSLIAIYIIVSRHEIRGKSVSYLQPGHA